MKRKAGKRTRKISATGERGFTLIELLVVLAILVLMAGLFPLALKRTLPGRRVEAASQVLVGALHNAQSLSIAAGRDVFVDIAGERINIIPDQRTWKLSAEARIQVGAIANTRQRLTFFPDGTSDGALIEVRAGTRTRMVRVSALTGRISVESR